MSEVTEATTLLLPAQKISLVQDQLPNCRQGIATTITSTNGCRQEITTTTTSTTNGGDSCCDKQAGCNAGCNAGVVREQTKNSTKSNCVSSYAEISVNQTSPLQGILQTSPNDKMVHQRSCNGGKTEEDDTYHIPSSGLMWTIRLWGLVQLMPYLFMLAFMLYFDKLYEEYAFNLFGNKVNAILSLCVPLYSIFCFLWGWVYSIIMGKRTVVWLDDAQTIKSSAGCLDFFNFSNRFSMAALSQFIGCVFFILAATLNGGIGFSFFWIGLMFLTFGNSWWQCSCFGFCAVMNDGGRLVSDFTVWIAFAGWPSSILSIILLCVMHFQFKDEPDADAKKIGEAKIYKIACVLSEIFCIICIIACYACYLFIVKRDAYAIVRLKVESDDTIGDEEMAYMVEREEAILEGKKAPPNFQDKHDLENQQNELRQRRVAQVTEQSTKKAAQQERIRLQEHLQKQQDELQQDKQERVLAIQEERERSRFGFSSGEAEAVGRGLSERENGDETRHLLSDEENTAPIKDKIRGCHASHDDQLHSTLKDLRESNLHRNSALVEENDVEKNEEENSIRTSGEILKDVWPMLLSVFLVFYATFCFFPVLFLKQRIWGVKPEMMGSIKFATVAIWGFVDPFPRMLATKYCIPRNWLLPLSIVRLVIFSALLMGLYFVNLHYSIPMVICALFSFSGGYLCAVGFIRSTENLTNVREKAIAAPWVGNCLLSGILMASITCFFWSNLI